MRKMYLFFLMVCFLNLYACAGLEVAMENSEVQVVSNLNDVPFFDIDDAHKKLLVTVQNFSEFQELGQIKKFVAQKYKKRGFQIVNNKDEADWILQAKIVNIKKEDISARELKGSSSSQAGMTGAGIGATAGLVSGSDLRSAAAGALVGGILTGAANLTVNSWVKLGYLTIVTDIQVKERTKSPVISEIVSKQEQGNTVEASTQESESNWLKYRFQALTRAKKVGLEWEDCKDIMVKEITRILSSIL